MNLHEYQAKEVLLNYGLPIPSFAVIENLEQAKDAIKNLQLSEAVLKIQVHAGGRGKGGGIKIAHERKEILSLAEQLIGMKLINEQTGPQGLVAKKIMITPKMEIDQEYYLSFLIDRKQAGPVLIACKEGGVNIEEVAKNHPENIFSMPIPADGSLKSFHILNVIKFFGWTGDLAKQGKTILEGLAQAFAQTDASLLEINPLILSGQSLWLLDTKLVIDDSALFRQKELENYVDLSQMSEGEALARQSDLAYIALDGEIGCMVNGAGLAMATMDIIKYYGGSPANFLDVGGGATKEKIVQGFKIILKDPNVKSIFVNIFGGIMNCGLLAEGIVQAAREDEVKVPLIIRLEGTDVDKGRKILEESKLNIITAISMQEGAEKAIKASRGQHADFD